MTQWNANQIPDQSGRTAIVTGANSGIGLVTATELARHGADVVLAVRDLERGERAAQAIRPVAPHASVTVARLDLADLASVRAFAEAAPAPDLLINNAGVMALPLRRTADGFEMQLGTNHLGHFALTGLLAGRMLRDVAQSPSVSEGRPGEPFPRVVTVSSGAHRIGRMRWDDLQWERTYHRWAAYGQSKLANLLFTYELARRARAAGAPLRAYAAHPGYAATNLQLAAGRMEGSQIKERLAALGNAVFAQSSGMGALPTLFAATVEELPSGTFVGPDGPGEMRGHPRPTDSNAASKDLGAAERLWVVSEALTGVSFDLGGP
jgi:NAD(P)-dependent dehydrogenase (short-subunit alcohol dehydrogenase family)